MKFWKKIMHFVLTICLIIPLMFTFTACGGSDGGGGGNGGGGGTTPVTPVNPDPPAPTDPVLQSASNSFAGAKAIYARTGYTNVSGSATTMEKLLDTQIDVLAQDILYRLTYVYGANENGAYNNKTSDNKQLLYDDVVYKLNNNKAVVLYKDLLTTVNSANHDSTHSITIKGNLNLNCLDCYQLSLNDTTQHMIGDNYLYNTNYMVLAGAIEGRYTVLNRLHLVYEANNGTPWNWWKADMTDSTYNSYINAYKNNFKMAIAEIISGKTGNGITCDYSEDEYNKILSSIPNLGYFDGVEAELISFIKNQVIGKSLVEKDDKIYNCDYLKTNNYVINDNFDVNAPYNGKEVGGVTYTADSEEVVYSPRLYKGYSKIVPAIVKQALTNTFEGTSTSLYPKMSRKAVTTTNVASGFSDAYTYQELIIKPKSGTKATKLVLKFQGHGDSVGKNITVGCSYAANSSRPASVSSKNVTLGSMVQTVEFNLGSGSQFRPYNGVDVECAVNGNPFGGKTELYSDGTDTNTYGTNYIKIAISGLDGSACKIELVGLYDKL